MAYELKMRFIILLFCLSMLTHISDWSLVFHSVSLLVGLSMGVLAFTVGARTSLCDPADITSCWLFAQYLTARHLSKSTQRQFEIQIKFYFLRIVLYSINGLLPNWFEVSRQRRPSTNIFPFQKFKCNKNVIQVWLNHRTRMHCFVVASVCSTLTPHPVIFLLAFSLSLGTRTRDWLSCCIRCEAASW